MMEDLTERFITSSKFTSKGDTPDTRKVPPAVSEFRYCQRFFVELDELTETYFTEFIGPVKRGAVVRLTCNGRQKWSFLHIVYPFDDGPVIAYRSNYFAAYDKMDNLQKDKTMNLIETYDDVLSKHLPKGLSKECAIDARFLIYFLRNYANQKLPELPEVEDIANDVKVVFHIKESKVELAGRESAVPKSPYDCLKGESVLYFEDKACSRFLELNQKKWDDSVAPISSSFHVNDGREDGKRTMDIPNRNPDPELVKRKTKYGGPFRTTLQLQPNLQDIGDGWKYFASLVLLLSDDIWDRFGKVYLARCIRACYGLSMFRKHASNAYGAQHYTIKKLATLRGACFMARSEIIYVDQTDIVLTDMAKPKAEKGGDVEQPTKPVIQDDVQMTIVPITHELGELRGENLTLRLEAKYKLGLEKPFLVSLSCETYGGHSPALNSFGSYISQRRLDDMTKPSSPIEILDEDHVEKIKRDWMALLDADRRLPGVAIYATEDGMANITVRDFEENGHIKWMEEYNYREAFVMLACLWLAAYFGWRYKTGAFHFIVALVLLDSTVEEVGLIGPMKVLLYGRKEGGRHQMIEKGTHTLCVVLLGLVEAFSDIESWHPVFKPYLILSCVAVSLMIIFTAATRSLFKKGVGLTYKEVIARDGSLECVLKPQGGGSFRACDRPGAYGLGLLQAQNYQQAFIHHGSLGTSIAAPGASLDYWVACG